MSIELSLLIKEQHAPSNMFWRGKLENFNAAKHRSGNPPRVAVYGDSNVVGQGAGSGTNGFVGARALSFPVRMAASLGWQDGSFFGEQNITVGSGVVSTYDPRISLGSFVVDIAATIPGGRMIKCVGVSATKFKFTPTNLSNKIVVWMPSLSGLSSSMKIYVDGVFKLEVNQNGSTGFIGHEISVDLGNHVVEVENANSGTGFIAGIETFDTNNANPTLLHMGWCGASLSDLSTKNPASPWEKLMGLMGVSPDVVILHCTINDIVNSTAFATAMSKFDAIMDACFDNDCDVANTISFAFSNAGSIDGTLDKYAGVMIRSALSLGGSFADARAVCGATYTQAQNLSLVYDGNHMNAAGYQKEADLFSHLFD